MPSAPLVFRAACGCFQPVFLAFMLRRAKVKAAMRIAMLSPHCRADGVTLGLLLTLMFWGGFLLRCGDVEQNPGPLPPKGDGMKQTSLTGGRLRSGTSRPASTSDNDSSDRPVQTPEAMAGLPPDPSLKDVVVMLAELTGKVDIMGRDIKELKEGFASLKSQMTDLKDDVCALKQDNETLKCENERLTEKVEFLDRKVDDLESRSKRNNIIIHGIPSKGKETWDYCEGIVRDMCTDKLDFTDDVQFDRVHRLNSKPDSPIIACCTFYKDKERILRARQKLKGTKIFVSEDFSFRVREVRRKLLPHLKSARNDQKKVTMVYDHLVIEGVKYGLDGTGSLVKLG